MIVILCPCCQDALDSFDVFMDFLETFEPFSIQQVFEDSSCVETDDDLRYLFVDYRLEHLFQKSETDFVDMDEFFEGINEFYFDGQEVMT